MYHATRPLVPAVLATLLLAACGGAATSPTGVSSGTASAPTPPVAPAPSAVSAPGMSAASAVDTGQNAVLWSPVVQAATGAGGGITKLPGSNWYGSGSSQQALANPGYLEFRVNNVGVNPNVNASWVCLDAGSWSAGSLGSLDYCIVPGAGVATVYVRGSWRSDTPLALADTLDIVAEAGAVRFKKNGAQFYAVTETPAWPLRAVWTSNFDGYGLASASLVPTFAPLPVASGGVATVAWDAVVARTDGTTPGRVSGYRVYYGTDPANLADFVEIPDPSVLSARFSGFAPGTWYFEVVALDTDGFVSDPSYYVAAVFS